MTDYTKLKVEEIRKLIIEASSGFITEEQVNEVKGKNQLIELHKSLTSEEVEEDIIEEKVVEQSKNEIPDYMSVGWHDYVMSLFVPDELLNGYPTVNGLRRVAQNIVHILDSGPKNVWTNLDPDKPSKATVLYEIRYLFDGIERKCSAVASSYIGNTDDEYVVFSESIAETRAEGRTLRKILGVKTVCADELTQKDTKEYVEQYKERIEDAGLINDVQIMVITKMCDRLGIDLEKFLNAGSRKYDDIRRVSYDTAAKMIQRLNEYQSLGNNVVISEDIKRESVNES